MTSAEPPNPWFSTINFNESFFPSNTQTISLSYANLNYLKRIGIATSVASLTTFNGDVGINGTLTTNGLLDATTANFSGQVNFNSLVSPPFCSILPSNDEDLCNKIYVDSQSALTAYQLYLNYSETFTTPAPASVPYKKLSQTQVPTPSTFPFTISTIGSQLIAGFFNTLVAINVPLIIPAGVWTLLCYCNVDNTASQNHIGLFYTLSTFNATGVEAVFYTSPSSSLINVTNPLIGTSSVTGTVPGQTLAVGTTGIGLKLYISSNTSATRTGNIFFQNPDEYTSILTSFAVQQAPDLLSLNNIWTGTNQFNNTTTFESINVGRGNGSVSSNISIGPVKAFSPTISTGGENIAIGSNNLSANTTGRRNVGIGQAVLQNNTTGSFNVSSGWFSLTANTTGNQNISFGPNTLIGNTTGNDNIAMGNRSSEILTSGSGNITIGTGTLGVATANNNMCLGSNAICSVSGLTFATAVGAGASVGTSDTVVLGRSSGNVSCPNTLTVTNDATIDGISINNGNVPNQNISVGYTNFNVLTTGDLNIALGKSCLSSTTIGDSNIAIGFQALTSNTTGENNVAIGFNSGRDNTVGEFNTYLGNLAGRDDTGSNQTAIGSGATCLAFNNSTAIGEGATVTAVNQIMLGSIGANAPIVKMNNGCNITGALSVTGAITAPSISGNAGSSTTATNISVTTQNLGADLIVPLINLATATSGSYPPIIGNDLNKNILFNQPLGKLTCTSVFANLTGNVAGNVTGNAASATTAAACTGNSASATTAASSTLAALTTSFSGTNKPLVFTQAATSTAGNYGLKIGTTYNANCFINETTGLFSALSISTGALDIVNATGIVATLTNGADTSRIKLVPGGSGVGGQIGIGTNAGQNGQLNNSIAIGRNAGSNNQSTNTVAIGTNAGTTSQLSSAVAIGNGAGQTNQASQGIAIGNGAAQTTQLTNAIAIGTSAGNANQAVSALAIGNTAGQTSQGQNCIAIGTNAGKTSQITTSIAIGLNAGQGTVSGLGQNSIAIGNSAGSASQVANSICLNASGAAVNPAQAGCFIRPIRGVAAGLGIDVIYYDPATFEVLYSTTAPTSTTVAGAGVSGAGSTLSVRSYQNITLGVGTWMLIGSLTLGNNGANPFQFTRSGLWFNDSVDSPAALPYTLSPNGVGYDMSGGPTYAATTGFMRNQCSMIISNPTAGLVVYLCHYMAFSGVALNAATNINITRLA